jgi:hypothetical protein
MVLMGQRLTPQQIASEWAEYQQIFDDILSRWSASLARQAKARKKELERLEAAAAGGQQLEMAVGGSQMSRAQRKAELRQRAAAAGLTVAGRHHPAPMPAAIPDDGDDD